MAITSEGIEPRQWSGSRSAQMETSSREAMHERNNRGGRLLLDDSSIAKVIALDALANLGGAIALWVSITTWTGARRTKRWVGGGGCRRAPAVLPSQPGFSRLRRSPTSFD